VAELRVLFVGTISQTTEARRDSFESLGVALETVDEGRLTASSNPFFARLTYWSGLTPPIFAFNREILARCESFSPDVIWIEKGVNVFPRTIQALKRDRSRVLVYHNTDDWRGETPARDWKWRYLLRAIGDYDIHVTSNYHNVKEFEAAGFAHVHHMELASNPKLRAPDTISEEDRRSLGAPVGFIGHWEPYSEELMRRLVEAGIGLKIYGGGWEHAEQKILGDACQHRFVWGDEYIRTALSFDIHLGIISAQNRSHTASRTFQVPALGAFMLHQRNELVTRYFEEDREIACFEGADELVEKCQHYLSRPDERRRIAAAGQRRCESSGYSETDRVREVLPLLERVVAERQGTRA
jgi:hypothetical protein